MHNDFTNHIMNHKKQNKSLMDITNLIDNPSLRYKINQIILLQSDHLSKLESIEFHIKKAVTDKLSNNEKDTSYSNEKLE